LRLTDNHKLSTIKTRGDNMDEIKQITLRLKQSLYEEVKNLAESESRNINQQIEYIIKKYLDLRR
jgi:hypothetical protein